MDRKNRSGLGLWAALSLPVVLWGCGPSADTAPEGTEAPTAASTGMGGQDLFGPYMVELDWLKPFPGVEEGWTFASVGAVYAESPDRIWIAMRGLSRLPPEGVEPWTSRAEQTPEERAQEGAGEGEMRHVIFVADRNGNVIQTWPQHDAMFATPGGRGPHKIKINPYDQEKHVWVIDDQLHSIFKFTYEGELVMQLGELGVPGRGPNNFARPTDIAWLPDGTFFISDGYDGTRVAKYDPNGNFIMDWGTSPVDPANPGPNEWFEVHSIAISQDRRLFVIDRSHERMQVFDENGNFLTMWSTREAHWPPYPRGPRSRVFTHHIMLDQATGEEFIWIGDGGTERILKYDLDGNFLYGWGQPGGPTGVVEPGRFWGVHQLTVDQEGNLFTAEVFGWRIQKFVPKPGADPSLLVGHEFRQYPVN